MAQGVYTRQKRITFVEKDISEVGDGTAYPLFATLDQIAEVYYRVKDAYYTGGQFTWDITSPAASASFSAPTTAPANRVLEEIDLGIVGNLQRRGYNAEGAYEGNGAVYDAGDGGEYSDIAEDERAILRGEYNGDSDYPNYFQPIINAFTYFSDLTTKPDNQWWGESGVGGFIAAIFNGEIAVVKVNPTDNIIASTNQYYIGFEFNWGDYDPFLNFGGTTNIYSSLFWGDVSATAQQGNNYVIRLASGDLTCPCYMFDSGITNVGGSDIIHEATEWFPYQDAGGNVWNPATGLPA
jgi:hypothetical protein